MYILLQMSKFFLHCLSSGLLFEISFFFFYFILTHANHQHSRNALVLSEIANKYYDQNLRTKSRKILKQHVSRIVFIGPHMVTTIDNFSKF